MFFIASMIGDWLDRLDDKKKDKIFRLKIEQQIERERRKIEKEEEKLKF